MRVPDQAAEGMARLTLSFPDWKEGHVMPAIAELPVKRMKAVASDELRSTLIGHPDAVISLACAPDAKLLASASCDGTIKLWDMTTGHEIATLQGEKRPLGWIGGPVSMAITPDQGRLLMGWTDFDLEPKSIVIKRLRGIVKVWDLVSRRELAAFGTDSEHGISQLTLSPDGGTLAAGRYKVHGERRVDIWDTGTRKLRVSLDRQSKLAFAADGSLITLGQDRGINVWDGKSYSRQGAIGGQSDGGILLTMAPDGKTFATIQPVSSGVKNRIYVWRMETRTKSAELELTDEKFPGAMSFSPDGKILVVALGQKYWPDMTPGEIAVFDASTLKRLATLTGHTLAIRCLAFSPDGHTLASGGTDKTVRLWNLSGTIARK